MAVIGLIMMAAACSKCEDLEHLDMCDNIGAKVL